MGQQKYCYSWGNSAKASDWTLWAQWKYLKDIVDFNANTNNIFYAVGKVKEVEAFKTGVTCFGLHFVY